MDSLESDCGGDSSDDGEPSGSEDSAFEEADFGPYKIHGVEMGVPTDERGRKLRGREPEPLFLVEWKDWPSPTTWTKKPYESFGDFKHLADGFKA